MNTTPPSQQALSNSTTLNPTASLANQDRQVMLSTQQDQALEWLMNGGSVTEAAEFAGVSRQTVSRWLHSDGDFRAVYESWREQVATMAEGQLIGLSEAAVNTLGYALRNRHDVKAATFVLKHMAELAKDSRRPK